MQGVPANVGYSLTQLQYFVAAAETGNISSAAEQLHVSQSAMSSAILRLERQLDCDLFLRKHARGITLTAHGHRILGEARALLRQAQDLEENGRALRGEISGELPIGCFATLAPFYIPPVLRTLRQRYPGLRVRVHEDHGESLAELLRSGTVEVAVCYGLELPGDLEFTPLAEHRPYALVDEQHPLSGRQQATLTELAEGPMVLLNLPQTRRFTLALLARVGARPPVIVRTTSFETMRGLVAAGEGFAVLNQRVATERTYDGHRVRSLELLDEVETVRVGTATVRGTRLSRRAQCFIEACAARARGAT